MSMTAANARPAVEAALAPEAVYMCFPQPTGPAARCRYAMCELLAARRQAVQQTLPRLADKGGVGGAASAAAGPAASGCSHDAQPQDPKGREPQQQPVESEGQANLRQLADVAAFRVAARPQESKGAQQPTGRFAGVPRALSGGSKEVPAALQLEVGAAEVYVHPRASHRAMRLMSSLQSSCTHPLFPSRAPQPQKGPPEFRSRVNSCPDLQALHAARQRLVCLAQEAGPGGLPLSQVLQRHLCTYNCLLEPHALGFDDLGALVRSAWPALQLRTNTKHQHQQQLLLQQQQQGQQQQKLEEEHSAPGQQVKRHGQVELTKEATVFASHGHRQQQQQKQQQEQQQHEQQEQQQEQQQQQQQQREQQLPEEQQKQQREQPSQERQEAGEPSLAASAAAAAACSVEKQQEQPRPSGLEELEGPVVVYVRPLQSLEAHLFSNLLFALIADAAEQHQHQQQQQQEEGFGCSACETPGTPKHLEPFSGVPFAALPRLWQEKYSALADLRHFQVAAGARDLCAFLEGLPEVTLQRKQGALLLSLVEGLAVPEGPQYIPNELRRPTLAAGGLRPVGAASAVLMQLPGHAPAPALLPGPTLLQQQHRRAAAAAPIGAASGPQQQQQQPSWQPSGWSPDSSTASLAGGEQQLCLQAAQTLLKHLQEQQQAAPEQQGRMREAAALHQQPAGTPSLDRRALLQPTSQQQQQQLQLQRLLREAVEGLEDSGVGRRYPKPVSLLLLLMLLQIADSTTASRDSRQGTVSAALQQAQQQQQQQQAAVAGVLAELLATQKLSRHDTTTELQRQLAMPQQQQQQQQPQVTSGNSTGRLQLRRRLLSFVRAACKRQRLQWHHNEDLSEMLISKQQQQQQHQETVDDISPHLRQQLLLLLQLDGQLQQLLQQQQASEQASSTMSTASPATGQEQNRGAAAAAVRRYLLRLLASPAVAAARSRHRLRTAGMTVSAMKQLWKHHYGESLSQRLEEAGVTFGELVGSEAQLFVLGTGRSLRIATRQHLEEFGLLQLPAVAPAQAASLEGAYTGGTPLAAKGRSAGDEKKPAVLPQAPTDQQRQKQLMLLLLQQMQQLQQQQQQQQQRSSTQSFSRSEEPQQQQHQQQPAPLQQGDQQEQTLQLMQRFLSGADSRGSSGHRAAAAGSSSSSFLEGAAAAARAAECSLTDTCQWAAAAVMPITCFRLLRSLRCFRLVYVLVAKLCQQQHAKHLLLRMQCEAPLQQEQPHLQLLQQQGRWKAAQDAMTLAENGIVGVRVSDLAAEWRRLYGCDLEAPMRHAGYANVLSLVSAVPGLFLVGEGLDPRCLVALPAAGQGQQRGSGHIEEAHAASKTALLSLGGECDHLKSFAVANE
ncbi:hypothetical protein Esti_004570 [Eimeria stiedai]